MIRKHWGGLLAGLLLLCGLATPAPAQLGVGAPSLDSTGRIVTVPITGSNGALSMSSTQGFNITVHGFPQYLGSTSVSSTNVILNLSAPIDSGAIVTLGYSNLGFSGNLTDGMSHTLANQSGIVVTNNSTQRAWTAYNSTNASIFGYPALIHHGSGLGIWGATNSSVFLRVTGARYVVVRQWQYGGDYWQYRVDGGDYVGVPHFTDYMILYGLTIDCGSVGTHVIELHHAGNSTNSGPVLTNGIWVTGGGTLDSTYTGLGNYYPMSDSVHTTPYIRFQGDWRSSTGNGYTSFSTGYRDDLIRFSVSMSASGRVFIGGVNSATTKYVYRYKRSSDSTYNIGVWCVMVSASGQSGTYTLMYGGQTTRAIAYNASAATVQAAVQALSSVGSGNATVYLTDSTRGTYTIVLASGLTGPLTANYNSLGLQYGANAPVNYATWVQNRIPTNRTAIEYGLWPNGILTLPGAGSWDIELYHDDTVTHGTVGSASVAGGGTIYNINAILVEHGTLIHTQPARLPETWLFSDSIGWNTNAPSSLYEWNFRLAIMRGRHLRNFAWGGATLEYQPSASPTVNNPNRLAEFTWNTPQSVDDVIVCIGVNDIYLAGQAPGINVDGLSQAGYQSAVTAFLSNARYGLYKQAAWASIPCHWVGILPETSRQAPYGARRGTVATLSNWNSAVQAGIAAAITALGFAAPITYVDSSTWILVNDHGSPSNYQLERTYPDSESGAGQTYWGGDPHPNSFGQLRIATAAYLVFGQSAPVRLATLPADGPTGGYFSEDGVVPW